MTEPLTREQIHRRNESAKRLLSDETVMAALAAIEVDIINEWARSNPTNVEGRENSYRLLQMIERLQNKLETWAADASVTEHRNDMNRKANEYA